MTNIHLLEDGGSTGAVFLKEPAVKNELKPRKTLAFLVV